MMVVISFIVSKSLGKLDDSQNANTTSLPVLGANEHTKNWESTLHMLQNLSVGTVADLGSHQLGVVSARKCILISYLSFYISKEPIVNYLNNKPAEEEGMQCCEVHFRT